MLHHRLYKLSKEGIKKHRDVLLKTIGGLILGAVFIVLIGLPRFPNGAYIAVNLILLAAAVIGRVANKFLDGTITGKDDPNFKKQLTTAGIVAAVVYVAGLILGISHILSAFIFIFDICMVVGMFWNLKDYIANLWDAIYDNELKEKNDFVGCKIRMDYVHPDMSMVTPFGHVYIDDHTVLFAMTNNMDGYVFVEANGDMAVYEKKLFSTQYKKSYIADTTMLRQAEEGMNKIQKIIEEGCNKRNVPVPTMAYSYAIYLPNFDDTKYMHYESDYENINWKYRIGSYKRYEKTVSEADYFRCVRGKLCFKHRDLRSIINSYNTQFKAENPGITERNDDDLNLIAEIIAEACDLAPDLKGEERFKQKVEEIKTSIYKSVPDLSKKDTNE